MDRHKRTDRLNHQFKEEISFLIQREVKDPRVGFATITRVAVTEDLSYAKVYVSVYGDEKTKKDTLKGLKNSGGFLRRRLGQMLRIRAVPELRFILDENAEHAIRISKIIDDLNIQPEDQPVNDSPESA